MKHSELETGGQIKQTEHRHQFKHPIDMPHQRDLRDRRVNFEVDLSHQYQISETHQKDLKTMVGPVYDVEKPHSYSDNYAPITGEKDRIEKQKALVSKFFAKEKEMKTSTG